MDKRIGGFTSKNIITWLFLGYASLSIASAQEIEYVSSTLYSGPITTVSTSGNYAYTSVVGMLLTFSISDPIDPTLINSYPLEQGASSQFVSGNYLYTGSKALPANFQIIDISNPAQPEAIGFLRTGTPVEDIFIRGDYAYLATGLNGLNIVDISNPSNPTVVFNFRLWTYELALSVDVSGDFAVLGSDMRIYLINVSNPASPQVAWQSNTQDNSDYSSTEIADTLAFIASRVYGIYIYNISNPFSPNLINIYDTNGLRDQRNLKIKLSGNLAYAVNASHLYIIDISNPESPNLLGTFTPPNENPDFCRLWLSYPYVFIADLRGFMRIVNVSDDANPILTGSFETIHDLWGRISLNGNYAYLWGGSEYNRMLAITDITDSSNPAFINEMELPYNIYDLYISGNYGYAASQQYRFYILNLFQPTNPQVLSSIPIPGGGYCVYKQGEYVYAGVRGDSTGMYIINISNPLNPNIVSRMICINRQFPKRIIVRDTIAYSLDSDSLHIIDVANPALPREICGWGGHGYLMDFDIEGNYAYVLESLWTFIIDISNPTAPFIVGHYVSGNCTDIMVRGNYLYLAAQYRGVSIVNVFDPANPYLLAYRPAAGSPYSLDVRDDLVYIADTYSLGVYRFNPTGIDGEIPELPVKADLADCYPNPFNPITTIQFDLPKASFVSLDIFDILGRKVETLINAKQEAGHHSIIWDGSDRSSGIYFYRIKADDFVDTKKMLLLK